MSAVNRPRVEGREVVKCECGLTQFSTNSASCRRCHVPFLVVEEAKSRVEIPKPPECFSCIGWPVGKTLPLVLKISRHANGMSQRDLAEIMGVPRTQISKIERGHSTPTLSSLAHYAHALNASPFVLMAMCEGAATG